jgi:UDP-N-acetylmuramoyl-L-alanyl-D-glutamate--2,6-diaminopimelate ligase
MHTFKDLLSGFNIIKGQNLLDQTVSDITQNSKATKPNSLFIAEKGHKTDGHNYIKEAIQNGAAALLVDNSNMVPETYNGIVAQVKSTRTILSALSAKYFDYPSQKLFCIGITGTNGKTSSTYLIETILKENQIKTGVIGTINNHIDSHVWETNMTTPDPLALQRQLSDFIQYKAKVLAIEVSSHSLDQKRVEGINFDVGVFTNLTHDHLDYHENMENYFQAKAHLFNDLLVHSQKAKTAAFVNGDDPWTTKIQPTTKMPVYTFGKSNKSSIYFILKSMNFFRTRFELHTPWGNADFDVPLTGIYNIYNVMGSVGSCLFQGQNIKKISDALKTFSGVPGRLHMVPNNKRLAVFVDYAHTPDALKNVLIGLNQIRHEKKSQQRIITVFGCGGDRDTAKRPIMANIAEQYSDFSIVTSDNPRSEEPEKIINEINMGFNKKNHASDSDRRSAINRAIEMAKPDDVILIAGKGHETYQIIGTDKFYFNDFETARELLK